MATLTAYFQFDYSLFDMNWYIQNYDTHLLDRDADTYTIFAPNNALALYGTDFGTNGKGQMVKGTVDRMSEWFYDDNLLAWVESYRLTGVDTTSQDFFDATQSATLVDDYSVIRSILWTNDLFNMSELDDHARGYAGNDKMYGFGGNDILRGDMGRDKLFGGDGEDDLKGGGDNDRLYGMNNNDILRGGDGDDFLRGGSGRDKVFGGSGEDLFQFKTGDDVDVIRDFESHFMAHDRIDLTGVDSISSWWDLKNNHMSQVGDDVVIDAGDGDMLILRDTDIGHLWKAYFDI